MKFTPDLGLLGRSAEVESLRRLSHKDSRNRLPVLLLGESGTDKEVAARASMVLMRADRSCPSIAARWSAP
jgi:DNA-binding NtrC family response regulator